MQREGPGEGEPHSKAEWELAANYVKRLLEKWTEPSSVCDWCTGFHHNHNLCTQLHWLESALMSSANPNYWRVFKKGLFGVVKALECPEFIPQDYVRRQS